MRHQRLPAEKVIFSSADWVFPWPFLSWEEISIIPWDGSVTSAASILEVCYTDYKEKVVCFSRETDCCGTGITTILTVCLEMLLSSGANC